MFKVADGISLGRFLLDAFGREAPPGLEVERIRWWLDANVDHPYAPVVRRAFTVCPFYAAWTLHWARSGFQRVQMGHKLAAQLMATHADDPAAMKCSPWEAYLIEVPAELVRVPVRGTLRTFDAVGVWVPKDGGHNFLVLSRELDDIITQRVAFPLAELGDISGNPPRSEEREAIGRMLDCIARLIIATELEMTDPTHVKHTAPPKGPKADSTAPSGIHRLIREVRVDCRAAVAAYISGERSKSPTVQTLVRGHYQRVAVGPGRSRRKWVHKEPYWRGPEDAPVAVHVHRLADEKKK